MEPHGRLCWVRDGGRGLYVLLVLRVDGNEQLLGFLELLAGLVDPSKLQLTELGCAWLPSEGDEVAACLTAAMERIFV